MADQPIKFYYFPRACSLATHIALEESGLPYERILINLRTDANQEPEYLAVNPKGAVPALQIGEQILTENPALLTYIADHSINGKLIPAVGELARYQAHEWMNYLSSSFHTYVRSLFRPSAYAGNQPETEQQIYSQAIINLDKAVKLVEGKISDQGWALGEEFSVVDAYLFVMYLWTTDERISAVPPRPKWDALCERIWQRPAVQHVVGIERQDRNYLIPWE